MLPTATRKGIYILSQRNEEELYRIYKVNISHERERVYRLNPPASILFSFATKKDIQMDVFFALNSRIGKLFAFYTAFKVIAHLYILLLPQKIKIVYKLFCIFGKYSKSYCGTAVRNKGNICFLTKITVYK